MNLGFLALLASFGLVACGASDGPPPPRPQSVLLVTIDTLRADRLGCYGYERGATPVMDGLATEGVRFENTTSVAPLTLPSHTSLMTGTIPPFHGVRDNGTHRALPELVTLAEVLSEEGWRTGAFTAAFVLDSLFGLDQGFQAYLNVPQRIAEPGGHYEQRPAHEVNADAFEWLSTIEENESFFLWVHYFEPHLPYPPAAELPAEFRDRPYDAEVASADAALGELLAHLRSAGRYDDTLIVLTSDHGESLGEHGELTHSFYVYQGVLHVPLIFAHETLMPGVASERVSLVDVMPTILEFLDVEGPPTPPPGRSLVEAMRGESLAPLPVYFESQNALLNYGWAPPQGIAFENHKWIDLPRSELYDLARDPGEALNLAPREAELAGQLQARLRELLEANEHPERAQSARRQLSAEERAKLAGLGYAGAASEDVSELTLADPKDCIERIRKQEDVHQHIEAGRFAEAEVLLLEFLESNPQSALFEADFGHLRMREGRHAEAVPHLLRSAELGHTSPTLLGNLGTCYYFTQEYDSARAVLEESLALNPKHLISHFWLARVLIAVEADAEARQHLERILALWQGGEGSTTEQIRAMLAELEHP